MAQPSQDDDVQLWTSIDLQQKLSKQWSIGGELEYRQQDNWQATERMAAGLGVVYKPLRWLKLDAGYKFIHQQQFEYASTSQTSTGGWAYKNYYPSYWLDKHRLYASLTASLKARRWTLSLRERWQYTLRPEQTVEYYDVSQATWSEKVKGGKGKNLLRSRLEVEFRLPKRTGLTPYASVEAYTTTVLDKMRYTAGIEWQLNKHNAFDLGYRYQQYNDAGSNDRNAHAVLVGYKLKF